MFWTMKKAGYRAVQVGLGLAMRVIPWQKPVLVEHPGAIGALPAALAEDGLHKVLVVTDRGVLRAGLVNRIYKELERAGVAVEVFSDVHANPTIPDILGGLRRYRAFDCEGVIALGGGSAMDASKMIAALVALPEDRSASWADFFR